jgi:hypothetical protein
MTVVPGVEADEVDSDGFEGVFQSYQPLTRRGSTPTRPSDIGPTPTPREQPTHAQPLPRPHPLLIFPVRQTKRAHASHPCYQQPLDRAAIRLPHEDP